MHDKQMKSVTSVFNKKNKRGKVVRVIRELYLRPDIYCHSSVCSPCSAHVQPILSSDVSHYPLPDVETTLKFLEIFEDGLLSDIIFTQTVVNEIQNTTSKNYSRLRSIISDVKRRSVVFHNENFEETYARREDHETLQHRNERAVCAGAAWYKYHLPKGGPEVVLISDKESIQSEARDIGLRVLSMSEYLSTYCSDSPSLRELYESLLQAALISEAADISNEQVYEKHKDVGTLEEGLESGKYQKGVLHVKSQISQVAYITVDERRKGKLGLASGDILIPGTLYRNRAVHLDVVCIEILPKHLWCTPSLLLRSEADDENEDPSRSIMDGMTTQGGGPKQITAKVVGILQRNTREYVATLQLDEKQHSGRQEKVLCVPMDVRIPKIRIPTRNFTKLSNSRLVVRIDGWELSSTYPHGHFVRDIGEINDMETEIASILIENEINMPPYTKEGNMLKHLPSSPNKWSIPSEELANRLDLRTSRRIFSIDPKGCVDIDDALSVVIDKDNGVVEVGVHIADVCYFVPPESLLDIEARARGTSVYLADRRLDMLPPILSEDLCSLRAKKDRFAVSVIWKFDATTWKIKDIWMGRTIIRTIYEMSYEDAQKIHDSITTPLTNKKIKKFPDYKQLRSELITLTKFAKALKRRRMVKGGLELASSEVKFKLDDRKRPMKLVTKKHLDIHSVIEEFMILANCTVAERIHADFPNFSLLRHHAEPFPSNFEDLIRCAKTRGVTLNVSSNLELSKSLQSFLKMASWDSSTTHIIKTLAARAMSEAQYINSGDFEVDQFYHYGLAVEKYTHFTSPIRRYADIIVHRTLLLSIEKRNGPGEGGKGTEMAAVFGHLRDYAASLNRLNRNAKNAQKSSTELFQVVFLKDILQLESSNCLIEDAIIYNFRKTCIHVFVPKYELKGTISLKDRDGKSPMPENALWAIQGFNRSGEIVRKWEVDEDQKRLVITTSVGTRANIELFQHLAVRISLGQSRFRRSPIQFQIVQFGADLRPRFSDIILANSAAKSVVKSVNKAKNQSRHQNQNKNQIEKEEVESSALEELSVQFEGLEIEPKETEEQIYYRTVYAETPPERSMYSLFQDFRDISLTSDDQFAVPWYVDSKS